LIARRLLFAAALPLASARGATLVAPDAVPDLPGARVARVLEGLENPWGLAFLPDGGALVTERSGRLRRIVNGALDPVPIAGVPAVYAQGQGGLLDIALSQNFAADRTLFLSFAEGTAAANHTAIARARLDGGRLADVSVIFRASPDKGTSQHFGSRLLVLPDGTLLASVGDGGNPPARIDGRLPRENAQRLDVSLGKIIRIAPDGTIPRDNPFLATAGAQPALFSVGHRNIQGLAWDATRQSIWSSEHGSSGGDELNLIRAGQNFGWPLATYSVEYGSGAAISPNRSLPGMQDPVLVWLRAIAPSGLAVHSGCNAPGWRGVIFAGGLNVPELRVVGIGPDGAAASHHRLPLGAPARDVREGPDGALYVVTDRRDGALLRITPG
jgi:glucose/arabinose dehydrogenase